MNENSNNEIETLIRLIEKRLNHVLKTPRDFDELSLEIKIRQNETISISTIKRILGYVSDRHRPSHTTLSVLARFVGCRDWAHFKQCLAENSTVTRLQPSGKLVQSSTLTPGDEVELYWEPCHHCRLKYEGNLLYRVTESANSNLAPGDTFKTQAIVEGQPIIATEVTLGSRNLMAIVLGEEQGIADVVVHATTPSAPKP